MKLQKALWPLLVLVAWAVIIIGCVSALAGLAGGR